MTEQEKSRSRFKQSIELKPSEGGTKWIDTLSQVYGEPYEKFEGNDEFPHQFAKYLLSPCSDHRKLHLTVSKPADNPFFRASLDISTGGHPSTLYNSAVTRIVINPKHTMARFMGIQENGSGFTLSLSRSGKFLAVWEP
ncbi:hypothetical protein HYT02_04605 [Candidatus Gottesmanbacteria bacterium]|nr:hypothetical protein [Candidatus Gottesmanbacteria bacterium]